MYVPVLSRNDSFSKILCTIQPHPLPASPLTLRYFCAYLSPYVRRATIKLYLSAIRSHHIQQEYQDPTRDTLLQYVIKGIKRTQSVNTRQRLPITVQVLKDLKTVLHNSPQLTYHDKRMLWAAFAVAFYGFLSADELHSKTVNSFDSATTLLWSDVTTTATSLVLHIRASKTDSFRHGCTITIGATATSTCPLNAMQSYIAIHQHRLSSPAFIFQDGSLLTRQRLAVLLRELLLHAGFDPDKYASHSFRIGAATTAAAAGLPEWQIQAMGRWTSDCYSHYIRPHPSIAAVGNPDWFKPVAQRIA